VSSLARRLQALGARVVEAPAIRVRSLEGPPLDPSPYDLVCVTSPNGAAGLFERLAAGGLDARALAGSCVAAIGPGTAAELAMHGIVADVVPERAVAEGLVEALAHVPVRRALIVRARQAREVLPDALRERGAEVEVLDVYETVAEPLDAEVLEQARSADYITFTSASTASSSRPQTTARAFHRPLESSRSDRSRARRFASEDSSRTCRRRATISRA
jgi:uroporphyrinogen III methyltransferase/synthase